MPPEKHPSHAPAPSDTATPRGRKKATAPSSPESSASHSLPATPGHASQNTSSPEGAREGGVIPIGCHRSGSSKAVRELLASSLTRTWQSSTEAKTHRPNRKLCRPSSKAPPRRSSFSNRLGVRGSPRSATLRSDEQLLRQGDIVHRSIERKSRTSLARQAAYNRLGSARHILLRPATKAWSSSSTCMVQSTEFIDGIRFRRADADRGGSGAAVERGGGVGVGGVRQPKSIQVEFVGGSLIEIPYSAIEAPLNLSGSDPGIKRLLRQIPEQLIYQLFDETKGLEMAMFQRHPLTRELSNVAGVPPHYLFNILHGPRRAEPELFEGAPSLEEIRKRIEATFPYSLLYFPTYRRIEEDLEHLGYQRIEGLRTEALIQFGMTDVNERLKKVTDQIKNSSVAWYSKIAGQMLSQLVDGVPVDETTRKSIENKDALKIVLDRIGGNITPDHKQHIVELVESGDLGQERYNTLVYFLSNLIKIYDQQKDLDNAIKEFTRVCNKYLGEKEVVYNESEVTISILQKWNRKPVALATLSSGEKQIISLFSRLYLEPGKPLALLFDEPELSLSIEWQRMLIPDIINTGRCKFFLATTHSPFVFENEFDSHAFDLSQFVTRL
jgi:hypothetical protein